jgi:hypothetical protein
MIYGHWFNDYCGFSSSGHKKYQSYQRQKLKAAQLIEEQKKIVIIKGRHWVIYLK